MTDTRRATQVGLAQSLDAIAPWLIELGNWIFGGFIGFNVVILGAVLTIVPVDGAVRIASAASAVALPPSAVGLVMLRLFADIRDIRRSQHDEALDSDREATAQRRNAVVRRFAYFLMIVSVLLTLAGVTASLWHIAWWVGVAFLVVLASSVATVFLAAAQLAASSRSAAKP